MSFVKESHELNPSGHPDLVEMIHHHSEGGTGVTIPSQRPWRSCWHRRLCFAYLLRLAAFHFAQRARWAAAIRFRAAVDMVLRFPPNV
jgi:hypothetical protein